MNSNEKPPPVISEEILFAKMEKNLPKSAPLFFRALAFLADGILVFFATIPAWRFLLPIFDSNGHHVLVEYWDKISVAYEAVIEKAAHETPLSMDSINALLTQAAKDEALISFFETAYTIAFVLAVLYFVLTEFFWRGQTLGKKIFGLRTVVFGSCQNPTFLQILSRAFWKAISLVHAGMILSLITLINACVVFFSRRHRGWHDRLSQTEVIDERQEKQETKA